LTANYVGLVERGQKQVTLVTLKSISDTLGLDVAVLFEGCTAPGKKSPAEAEITALNEAARSMGIEDLKALRTVGERLAKKR